MPRAARWFADNGVYHVVNRGNGRQDVFHKPGDFAAFVELMGAAKERVPVRVLAYCLMTNHFHLLLQPECGEDLSRWMQWLMTSHVRRYHMHYRSSGHVWQGRFKSFQVKDDDQLLTAMRYVEGNPVRAGMVASARDWPWSSHRERLGTGSADEAVPVPFEAGTATATAKAEAEAEAEGQAEGQAPSEPVPVVDQGMITLPEDWTGFVDTPLTAKELGCLGLAPGRVPVPL